MNMLERLIENGNNGLRVEHGEFAEARALVATGDAEMWETTYTSGPGAIDDSTVTHICLTDEASIKHGIYTAADFE